MKELKPCPFCGSEKLVIFGEWECKPCYTACYTVCCDFRQGGCGATSGYRETEEEEAIEAWNTKKDEGIRDEK